MKRDLLAILVLLLGVALLALFAVWAILSGGASG